MKYVTILSCAAAVAGLSIHGPDSVADACSFLTNPEEIKKCQVKLTKRNEVISYYEDQVDDDLFELEFKPLLSEDHGNKSNITSGDKWDAEDKNEVFWENDDENEVDSDYKWSSEDEWILDEEGEAEDGIEEVFYWRDEKTGQLTKETQDRMPDVIVSYNLAESREDGFDEFQSEVEYLASTIDKLGTYSDPDSSAENSIMLKRVQILGELFEKLDAVDISRWTLRPEISKLKEDLRRASLIIPILKIVYAA